MDQCPPAVPNTVLHSRRNFLYFLPCNIFYSCTVSAPTVQYFLLLHGRRKSDFYKSTYLRVLQLNFILNFNYCIAIWQKIGNCPKNDQKGQFLLQNLLFQISSTVVLQIPNTEGMFGSTNTALVAKIWHHSWLRHSWFGQILVATRAVFLTTKRLRRLVFIYYFFKVNFEL